MKTDLTSAVVRIGPRTRRCGLILIAAVLAPLCAPKPALAWGCKGHQTVALIAEKHLSRHARKAVRKILLNGPVDPKLKRYCESKGLEPFVDVSTWPDDIRKERPETAPWHYIDIPRGAGPESVQTICPPEEGCLTHAIRAQLDVLRDTGNAPEKRAEALRFLLHFVGDLHQPLHATTNNDLGGNCVPVAWFGKFPEITDREKENYRPNLHGVWDTDIVERLSNGENSAQLARSLDTAFHSKIKSWRKLGIDVDAWAWEGHQLAEQMVYGKLPHAIPVEVPQTARQCSEAGHVSARMLQLNEQLDAPYFEAVSPVVREQLAKAGIRLAMLLNEIWP
jgi:hypothetical protein